MDRIPGMAKGRDEQDCHDGDGRGYVEMGMGRDGDGPDC